MNATHRRARGFTLIELLVVISIIALLIGVLLPALGAARKTAKTTVCGQNLHQLSIGIAAYAVDNKSLIPRGPHVNNPSPLGPFPGPYWDQMANNQVWIKDQSPALPAQYNGYGVLFKGYIDDRRAVFCPGDDTIDPVQELARISDPLNNAFSSYFFRQLDETTAGRIDDLGTNSLGSAARALLIDANSLLASPNGRTNHDNLSVNIAFLDGHVKNFPNTNNVFTIRAADAAAFVARMHQIMQNADYAEASNLSAYPNP